MHIVIIGNGVAGVTAARHIRKLSNHSLTIISSESEHFFSRTALMYVYMGHLTYEQTKPYEDWFWAKNRIELVHDHVEAIMTDTKTLRLQSGKTLEYDKLIIATGSRPRTLGWKGQDLQGVQGFYSLQDLQRMILATDNAKRAVVVGGGLIGIETAEMLHSRKIPVTFLVRERRYWNSILPDAEADMITAHIRKHKGVDLCLETELREILDDGAGAVRGVLTSTGEEIPCDFVALTVGVEPNIDIVQSSGIKTARGVLVNEHFEASVEDVYAVGDCAEMHLSDESAPTRVEQLWYAARAHGERVARNICGERESYKRSTSFNSAKFFDIEYQTYGNVAAKLQEGEKTLVWRDADGKRLLRIVFANDISTRVLGFNVLGVRYRHNVCVRWIEDSASVEEVLENLGAANFDPEFSLQCEAHLIAEYNRQTGRNLTVKRRRSVWNAAAVLVGKAGGRSSSDSKG